MSIKRTLFNFGDRSWMTSTAVITAEGRGLKSGQVGIFWPLTADGTFGASISTKVTGYEYVLTNGTVKSVTKLDDAPDATITVTIDGDDKSNHKRLITVANTGSLGIVQINVVQEDLPWYYGKLSDFERFEMAFAKLDELGTRVKALETQTP